MSQRSIKILVVDDEPAITDLLTAILSLRGYEAMGVYDAVSALQQARRWQPRVILSDVMLPDGNGVELAIRIRSELPACAILLFSGQPAAESLVRRAREQGQEFEVLAKPVGPEELLGKIAALCVDQKR